MEMMLKKGKRGEGGVRPESPTGRRKRPIWHRGPTMHFKPRLAPHPQHEVGDGNMYGQPTAVGWLLLDLKWEQC